MKKLKNKKNDGGYGKEFEQYTVYHPIIKELFGTDEDLPNYVKTAHSIDPFFRVKMQGTLQKYIDSSISSTVNLREDIPVETVADIYIPLNGEITEVNRNLEDTPESINKDPYKTGWLLKIRNFTKDNSELLSASEYIKLIK